MDEFAVAKCSRSKLAASVDQLGDGVSERPVKLSWTAKRFAIILSVWVKTPADKVDTVDRRLLSPT